MNNQIKPILGLIKASVLYSLRNKTALFFNFIFPFVFITIFGILGYENGLYKVALRDSFTSESPLYSAVTSIEAFDVQPLSDNEIDTSLKKGDIGVALGISADETGQIKLTIEQSLADYQSAQTITLILNSVISEVNVAANPDFKPLIAVDVTEVEGSKFKQIDYILPGQLAFALLMNALFGISYAFVSMRRDLVIKRIFAAPVKRWSILIAESTSKVIIALIQALLIILVGYFVFDYTLANGYITVIHMLILSLVGISAFIGFGLLIPGLANDENAVTPISQLIMMPQLFLSGAFFPIEAFPEIIQPIAKILPMTLLNDAFQTVAFEGAALSQTLPEIGGLLVWAVVLFIIDIRLFKWE